MCASSAYSALQIRPDREVLSMTHYHDRLEAGEFAAPEEPDKKRRGRGETTEPEPEPKPPPDDGEGNGEE